MEITSSVDLDSSFERIDYSLGAKLGGFDVVILIELFNDGILKDLLFVIQHPDVASGKFDLLHLGLYFTYVLSSLIKLFLLLHKVCIHHLGLPNVQIANVIDSCIIIFAKLDVG